MSVDWVKAAAQYQLIRHLDPDLPEAEYEALAKIEIDRSEAVAASARRLEAFGDELEAGLYEHAAELKLIGVDGRVDPSAVEAKVGSVILGEGSEAWRLAEVIREARAKVETAMTFDPPPVVYGSLTEALKADIPETRYRVQDLAIERGNVLLAAQFKSGKSTLMFNLLRSLADGEPFLGFDVQQLAPGRTVSYWDFELDAHYSTNQLGRLGIENTDAVVVEHLRGHSIPLDTDVAKAWAVERLASSRADVWVIDPFAAVFQGDENSNTEVGQWLRAVDEIKRKAGVSELVLVTHTGRSTEGPTRARGATRIDDWADVRWTWEKDGDQRKLKAHGRGVSQGSVRAEWDPVTNRYERVEGNSSVKPSDLDERVIEFVTQHRGASKTAICDGVVGGKQNIIESLGRVVAAGSVIATRVGRTTTHALPDADPSGDS